MSPPSWAHAATAEESPHWRFVNAGRCFIGLPAQRDASDAARLDTVVRTLLDRHERVLVLLESELMSYRRSVASVDGDPAHRSGTMADRVIDDTMERWREVDVLRKSLPGKERPRLQIASWAHFIDPTFAALWRQLLNAFAVVSPFRRDALRVSGGVTGDNGCHADDSRVDRADSLCRVEALAMRLRVAEVAGYHHEYGEGGDDVLTGRLYARAYAPDGLTVEALVGNPAKRVYREI